MIISKVKDKTIRLVLGDITDLECEAFVYDITGDAKLGSGYGSAITARGGKTVQEQLNAIGSCPAGHAILTTAGKLKAKHIIHVNGPKFHEPDTEGKLRSAVLAALQLAEENGITQLAFPPIGTGLYQVPLDLCARVMVDTVTEYLARHHGIREIVFVALDPREHAPIQAKIAGGA